MNRIPPFVVQLLLAATAMLWADPETVQAQFVTRPTFNSQSQYIPGLGVVRTSQFFDPNTGLTRTTTHSYFGSQSFTTQGLNNNPLIVGYRTVYVSRWVMTPFGPQLVQQAVTIPVTP